MSIDPEKQYRTRDGRPVRIYAVEPKQKYAVHGAYHNDISWVVAHWTLDGRTSLLQTSDSSGDLIEVTLADELTEQIPWEALRPEIQWVAMNEYGEWQAYEKKPALLACEGRMGWHNEWEASQHDMPRELEAVNMPEVDRKCWRETLCRRPEGR